MRVCILVELSDLLSGYSAGKSGPCQSRLGVTYWYSIYRLTCSYSYAYDYFLFNLFVHQLDLCLYLRNILDIKSLYPTYYSRYADSNCYWRYWYVALVSRSRHQLTQGQASSVVLS